MAELGFENILDEQQIGAFLFGDDSHSEEEEEETPTDEEKEKGNKEKKDTAEVDPDNMFEEKPESVGSEEHKDNEEDTPEDNSGTSPDFFSSIATAIAEEGIFPDLDEERIGKIKTAADLREAIEEQMKAGLDEQQRRVAEALDNDVEPAQIKQYENLISNLEGISEKEITAEDDEGNKLRANILFRDYINRGFSKERAEKMVKKSFDDGNDVEDAKEALESVKTFYKDSYQELLDNAKAEKEREKEEELEKAKRIKKSILEDDIKFFGDVEIDKATRQAAFDAISKPIYKDPKTGQTYTAVQKMELDNPEEFMAKIGLICALTDNLKSIDGLVKKKVKKEVKRGLSNLESKINNTSRDSRGNLRFSSGVDDSESILGKGMRLDL